MPAKKKTKTEKAAAPARNVSIGLDFTALVDAIRQVHEQSAAAVNRTVNTTLTLRNWVIGWYIREYEQNGSDCAKYGEGLLDSLAERLSGLNVSNCNRRQLYRYLRFFQLYPEVVGMLSPQLRFLPGLASGFARHPMEAYAARLQLDHLFEFQIDTLYFSRKNKP